MNEFRSEDLPEEAPDPGRFFRRLAQENPPEEFWAGFWPSVRAGIREAESRRETLLTRGRALLLGSTAGVMAAAAVLVAAFLVVPTMRPPGPGGKEARTALRPAAPGSLRETVSPPVMEDLRSSSARVYTFQVGETENATDVILIVDESLDI